MKEFIQQNKIFLILHVLFLLVGGVLILTFEKGNETLYFSALHTPYFDQFFKWASKLDEWPILIYILIVAVRFSYGKGLLLGVNSVINLIIIQVLKRFVFSDEVRPYIFFEGKAALNFVPGVEIEKYHSFPSGHTAAAFALFFMLSILVGNKRWSAPFFFLALLVGISRVYLLQHFFRDIYFGSLIGVFFTAIFYLIFVRSSFYNNLSWKDKRLFK